MRAVFLAIPAALLMTISAQAQEGFEGEEGEGMPPVPEGAIPAAVNALQTFSELVTEENAGQMGFRSPEEVKKATLGVPALVFVVRLDALKRYQEDQQDPRELLIGGVRAVYPVLVDKDPRSSIEVVKEKAGWRAASFGAPNFAQQLSQIREEKANQLQRHPSEFSIIRVPALSLYFLGYMENELKLTPLVDDARFKFKAGESLSASDVIHRIQETAKKTLDRPG